ncbi:PREDICTED: WD repeat-containing protein KIAA1875 homolog [Elephantulus edwardii]|uniref:WD repeat-containing protein KIAA1875 homolog n=1 Tax=Elephantulus edwardii TaxID=28737 RepID=UPI0003F0B92A|nr:PREDICTED: WD repeat-containing protein KIAA1875 homolog [Elephantulus edwardii]
MLSSTHHQKAKFQQSVLQEVECFLSIRPLYQDLEALAARDQDLQRLRLGHVVPVVRAMPSLKQRQEAFDNYLRLIYGPGLVELQSKRPSQQWSYMTLSTDSRTLPTASSFHWWAEDFMKGQPMPPVLPPKDLGTLCQRLLRPPRVPLPLVPASREVHSQASQLLAKSSLSCSLGLSLDLQLQSDHFWKGAQVFLETLPSDLPKKILRRRHPKELHSSPQGFFPAAIQTPNQKLRLQPILSSSFIPNSVVLQHLWQQEEMGGLGTLVHLSPDDRHKPRASWDNLRLSQTTRRRSSRWQHRLLHLLEEKLEVEDEEEEVEEEDKEEEGEDWIQVQTFHSWQMSGSKESLQGSESEAKSIPPPGPHTSHFSTRHRLRHRSSPWEKRLAHLPGFLQYFVSQNWFKKLFPTFTLEAYPEMSTVEGLASLLMDLLEGASWDEGVHILAALLRLLPEVSGDLCRHLQGILVHLLNLDQPPSLQDRTQKQFVMLALQLLLACTLESRDVVLELLSYFLYSPAECQAELRKLLYALGLQDPQGILFKEMKTWVPGSQMDSKAWLRNCCHQKLEDMVQNLQVETGRTWNLTDVLRLPEEEPQAWRQDSTLKSTLSRAGQPLPWAVTPPEDTIEARLGSAASSADGRLESVRDDNRALGKVPPQVELGTAPQKSLTKPSLVQQSRWHTRQTLSDSLQAFHMVPEVLARSVPAKAQDLSKMFEQMHGVGLHGLQLPLEQTQWSQAQLMDMEYIDALNLFCERQLAQQWGLRQEEPKTETKHESPVRHVPNTVVPQPLDRRYHPVPRLQEPQVQIPRGRKQPWLCAGGPLRLLKLPLPRVEPQPFPPDWPMPARPLPPLLLQPSLQRYFVPDKADPDKYS